MAMTNIPQNFDGCTVKFLTAWSSVSDLMKKLSSMFPDIRFDYKWADEDFGHNTGEAEFRHGPWHCRGY
jgi:hypothetical protein